MISVYIHALCQPILTLKYIYMCFDSYSSMFFSFCCALIHIWPCSSASIMISIYIYTCYDSSSSMFISLYLCSNSHYQLLVLIPLYMHALIPFHPCMPVPVVIIIDAGSLFQLHLINWRTMSYLWYNPIRVMMTRIFLILDIYIHIYQFRHDFINIYCMGIVIAQNHFWSLYTPEPVLFSVLSSTLAREYLILISYGVSSLWSMWEDHNNLFRFSFGSYSSNSVLVAAFCYAEYIPSIFCFTPWHICRAWIPLLFNLLHTYDSGLVIEGPFSPWRTYVCHYFVIAWPLIMIYMDIYRLYLWLAPVHGICTY